MGEGRFGEGERVTQPTESTVFAGLPQWPFEEPPPPDGESVLQWDAHRVVGAG